MRRLLAATGLAVAGVLAVVAVRADAPAGFPAARTDVVAARTDPAASRPGGAEELRLRATGEQWRTHEVARELAVALRNDGDVPVQVSRVEPVLPSFEGEAAVDTDTLLPPGGLRVDVPVPYGTGGCLPAAAPSHVVVHARAEGATRWQRLTVPLPHPNPLLDKLSAADCAAERVRQSVTLSFGPWQDLGPQGLRGSLIAVRKTTDSVRVHALDGNVMYDVTMPPGPLAELTAAAPRAEIPLTVAPQRCDLHAFAEVKKPYEFPARIALGGADPLVSTVPVDDDDRAALDTMLRRLCDVPAAGR